MGKSAHTATELQRIVAGDVVYDMSRQSLRHGEKEAALTLAESKMRYAACGGSCAPSVRGWQSARSELVRRQAAELEPTVKWTPENARKGGMRFYAFYKDLHWSGDRPVPYEFWPRSTQPGDKWRHRLRENSVQAFGGFFGGHEPSNTKIQEDIAAGCKRIKGKLRPETIQWSISCDFPVAKDDPAAYARIPMLVSANLNPACLLREWDGAKDADKVIPLGPKSGAEKSLFGDECAVIVFNDGSGEIIPAEELTYARIYRRAFKGPPLLGYLTVRGFVEPKGMSGDRTTKPPNYQTISPPDHSTT